MTAGPPESSPQCGCLGPMKSLGEWDEGVDDF
jgi:hypothetical protein